MRFLPRIRRPTLLLGALDNQFLPLEGLANVAIMAHKKEIYLRVLAEASACGFVSGLNPRDTHYYAEERVVEFLAHHSE
jgi:predicted alpha/beta-fold hydrolase